MFGFFKENRESSGWFSWDGIGSSFSIEPCNTAQDFSCFEKEPERDYFQDWLDLKWAEGDTDFDPLRPL